MHTDAHARILRKKNPEIQLTGASLFLQAENVLTRP